MPVHSQNKVKVSGDCRGGRQQARDVAGADQSYAWVGFPSRPLRGGVESPVTQVQPDTLRQRERRVFFSSRRIRGGRWGGWPRLARKR